MSNLNSLSRARNQPEREPFSLEIRTALAEPGAGLYFDRGPDASRYLPHVEQRPPPLTLRSSLIYWG